MLSAVYGEWQNG